MSWACVEAECEHAGTGEERTFYNVIPCWGPKHEPHPDCWCEPEQDGGLVIHREVH